MRWFVVALLLLAGMADAAGAALSPIASAEAIRSARSAKREAVVRLVYDIAETGRPASEVTYTLASDWGLVEAAEGTVLIDFAVRRRFRLDRQRRVFASSSLYGDVAFREIELFNRIALRRMLQGSTGAAHMSPLRNEAALGLREPDEAVVIDRKREQARETFRSNGEEFAAFVPATNKLPPGTTERLAKLWRHVLPLHPAVSETIGTTAVPRELTFANYATIQESRREIRLKNAEQRQAEYPIGSGWSVDPTMALGNDASDAAVRSVLPGLIGAVTGTSPPPARSHWRRRMEAALNERRHFAAYLLIVEEFTLFGRPQTDCPPDMASCTPPGQVGPRVGNDPRVQQHSQAISLDQARQHAQAADLMHRIPRDGIENAYVLGVAEANMISAGRRAMLSREDLRRQAEASEAFAEGLRQNPFMAAYTKDFGDHLARDFRADLAWLLYDLGRALPIRSPTDNLRAIDLLEQDLAKRHPRFF